MWDKITLGFLSLITIRQLVAQNFDIPLKKLRWLIYDTKSPVLCRRAYETSKQFENLGTNKQCLIGLLSLASRHIKNYPDGLLHGRNGGHAVESKYFINTLEASYNEYDLSVMTTAIRRLIANSGRESNVDFVLCLKNGNQILARNIYHGNDNIKYICKLDQSISNYPIKPVEAAHENTIVYENLDVLLKTADMATDNLNGIAIDCSVSSGFGLSESIKNFNEMVKKYKLRINPIADAFVLFCHRQIDETEFSFNLHRFFDMDEEIRKSIYANSNGTGWQEEVFKSIQEKALTHY